MGIPSQQLESKVYPLIISEVDFPRIYYNMMLLVLVLTALWALYNIVRCIYSVCCPWKVSGMQVVSGGKADRNTVRDIDEQLRYNLYYDQDGIAITDKYLVYHGTWHTDVVELSTIETFKKLRTSANIGPADKKIYKLLMVDVDGVTYEQDFKTEAAIDEALSYLRDSGKNKTVYAVRYQTDRTYCFCFAYCTVQTIRQACPDRRALMDPQIHLKVPCTHRRLPLMSQQQRHLQRHQLPRREHPQPQLRSRLRPLRLSHPEYPLWLPGLQHPRLRLLRMWFLLLRWCLREV